MCVCVCKYVCMYDVYVYMYIPFIESSGKLYYREQNRIAATQEAIVDVALTNQQGHIGCAYDGKTGPDVSRLSFVKQSPFLRIVGNFTYYSITYLHT